MGFDILSATRHITDKYTRYLKTMFDIADPQYKKLFDQEMERIGSFYKGPYLDVVDSFENGKTVPELIKEGILNTDLVQIKDIYSKTLFKHQESSLRKITSGRNIVVSTGTGSGKTESFLIPILNSLMNERKEQGKITPGVRALLIYPMNALANDQISRLRSILSEYPYITFGSYTGQTKEKEGDALEKYKSLNHGQKPLKNEIISRERMKEFPPNILITNYSMLEYLMLRPKDNSFFQGQYANNWRYIVLDEAHTYSGSTGIEVSMLIRRLKAYIDNPDLRFVLTSATLGNEDANNEVAEFAKRLCNAPFSSDDVIRASRIKLQLNKENSITLSSDDYLELSGIVDSGYDDVKLLEIILDYLKINEDSSDYNECLFNVLIKDTTFWKVKNFLSKPKSVKEICNHMSWNEKELSAFVNVASKAIKNRKKLFDSRYHMFIRATDGVFVTLGDRKELSLKRINYTDDKEYRYFEIVTCNQCHAIYLLGSREYENGKIVLKQKTNLSGDGIREAYLVGNATEGDDEIDDDSLQTEAYELCPKCGFIRLRDQVHKTRCEHEESKYITLTRVRQSERTGRVTKCVRCGGFNNLGVLRSFFSGQEASTSVIGTALFEELPSKEVKKIEVHLDDDGFDDGFSSSIESNEFESKAKQFIAFSDNRQAAAFFATYFYETYQGFLYSRIVYDNIKKTDEEGKPIKNFVNDMSRVFKEHRVFEMFDDYPDYLKESWKAVLKELINSYSRNSLIGLGLMKVDFNDDVVMQANSKFKMTENEIKDICLVLASHMFADNAISHGQNFTESDIAFYSNNGSEEAYVLSNLQNKYVKSFLPKTDYTTNKRYDYIERVFKEKGLECDREIIQKFLSALWKRMFEANGLLINTKDFSGKRIDLKKFKIVNTNKWYRCPKCHRVTAYNVEGVCPAYRCEGKLQKIDAKALIENNHYYRIYNELDIQPLRVVEHTAQLSNEEAYLLQEKFKRQEIDVLSCSTTFEMGVDIGDLETVFMRNMPPTPSNYIQRAGRAGRSTKSAALALTFCNKSNHDFSFFEDPVSMINGTIKPPLFKVENEKIGIRHLYSVALASFWRSHPAYFGTVGECFGAEWEKPGYRDFKEYLESRPKELKSYLLKVFPESLIQKYEIDNFGWVKWLFDEANPTYPNLKMVYEQYRNEMKSLFLEKKKLEESDKPNGAVIYRINTYTRENIISFLSRNNILPKYGFPVDTVDLEINSDKNRNIGVELSRDLSMAISEYAPGCEVVAAGNLIKSRYIKKIINKAWRTYDYVQCQNCKTLNIDIHHDTNELGSLHKCKQCGQEFEESSIKTFIVPEFGFISESKINKPSLIKPDRTYRSEATLVARGSELFNEKYKYGGLFVEVVSMEDGEIAVLNKSDFFVCPTCGFSLGEVEAGSFANHFSKDHKTPSGYLCKNKDLVRYSLGYRFKTDAIYIGLSEVMNYEEAYSVLQAIILSACNLLNIDNSEIAGCLQYKLNEYIPSYDFIVYDTTPGGAGHVKRLIDENIMHKVLRGAYYKAKNCDCGGEEGDSSCYKCLRTYQNQQHHDEIKRKYVVEKLQTIDRK